MLQILAIAMETMGEHESAASAGVGAQDGWFRTRKTAKDSENSERS